MPVVIQALVVLVAALHAFFFVLEAFLWKTPFGRKVFRTTPEFAAQSAALAANQGLYNLFLTAGLVWSLALGESPFAWWVAVFFLACVTVAGIVGALTVNKRIFFIQAAPAIAAPVIGLLAY